MAIQPIIINGELLKIVFNLLRDEMAVCLSMLHRVKERDCNERSKHARVQIFRRNRD